MFISSQKFFHVDELKNVFIWFVLRLLTVNPLTCFFQKVKLFIFALKKEVLKFFVLSLLARKHHRSSNLEDSIALVGAILESPEADLDKFTKRALGILPSV